MVSMHFVGEAYICAGRLKEARDVFSENLDMGEALYPGARDAYARQWFAVTHNRLGYIDVLLGKSASATDHLLTHAEMSRDSLHATAQTVGEAQSLSFTEQSDVDLLLSAGLHTELPAGKVYRHVWERRSIVARAQRRIAESMRDAPSSKAKSLHEQWNRVRRQLGSGVYWAVGQDQAAAWQLSKAIESLWNRKDRLERQLLDELKIDDSSVAESSQAAELPDYLPPRTAFVDFVHYYHPRLRRMRDGSSQIEWLPHYVAFVIQPGRPIAAIRPRSADEIHDAVRSWWQGIRDKSPEGIAAQEVRRVVWEDVEKLLKPGVERIYVCPGQLQFLPWAALPTADATQVLLEQFAFAIVPDGPFLLESLQKPVSRRPPHPADLLTIIGDLDYGPQGPFDELLWGEDEFKRIVALAVECAVQRRPLPGDSATVSSVASSLPGSRWAHLTTHGFFADRTVLDWLNVNPDNFVPNAARFHGVRADYTIAKRNPLLMSALALSGVNNGPNAEGEIQILTGEAIAGLDLSKMELAVLSACQTGLGVTRGLEGNFSLARAFHTAGARDVVVSRWLVNDFATAELMKLFYTNLWKEQMAPIDALREAQLKLYHDPHAIPQAYRGTRAIGPPQERVVITADSSAKLKPYYWASFVVSGYGQYRESGE